MGQWAYKVVYIDYQRPAQESDYAEPAPAAAAQEAPPAQGTAGGTPTIETA